MAAAGASTADRLVAAQARRTPDATAALHGEARLTYGQLDEAAGRLAAGLAERGIRPGDRVGLCLAPGLDRCVALLGTLRAGAAYVPLDPAYPRARLELMARDAALALIVASPGSEDLLPDLAPLETPGALVEAGADPTRGSRASLPGPAYLIYTSGSTGTPKGVVMPHRALANLIDWQIAQPGFGGPLRTLQFTPLSFDVHFQEIFATWAVGGELVLVDDAVRRDATRLLSVLDRSGVERIFLPFVALQQLAEVGVTHGPMPRALKEVVTAGEQLLANEVIRSFFERLPDCRLHNHYGPSETHVVTAYTLEGAPASWPLLPPIGRAIANSVIHLLGEDGRPVPVGEAGELCAAGACLADGYWRRPELTEARFVAGPDGGRMYRTGDLAHRDAAGDLHFMGRLDDQLKIRGHRVEPGEVEAEILEHPAVRECAVAARDDGQGGRRLTAYLVLDSTRPEVRERAEAARREKLAQWQGVWEGTYAVGEGSGQGTSPADLDLRGWVDSTHGRPIPAEEMRSWAQGSADQVLALKPRRVLEIGAGTGLMLFRIAPHCEAYHATDFSARAVALLRERTADGPPSPEFRLDVAAADEIEDLPGGPVDLVLMNSVTQHFPGVDYLLRVLGAAVRRVGRGHVFVGDVTSARHREAFWASVEGARARPADPLSSLRGRVERRLGQEEELVIDPELFRRLGDWIPGVGAVEVRLKPGRYRNELSRFRYDVLIHTSPEPLDPLPAKAVDWAPGVLSEETLEALSAGHPGSALHIRGIPNARMVDAVAAVRALRAGEGDTVAEWRAIATERAEAGRRRAVEPDDLSALGRKLGRAVEVTWGEAPETVDLVLRPAGTDGRPVELLGTAGSAPPEQLASLPLNIALMPQVEAELRQALARALPDPMIPDRFELLARLPMTPSGKLDRRALPEPGRQRPALPHDYVAPRGATEEALAEIWSELLGIDRVGATDSFFDLGGNSILTVRLAARITKTLARELPLVSLFHYPTVRALAAVMDASGQETGTLDDGVDDRAEKQRRAFSSSRRLRRK
ncbi:MAG TPA: amino acid adenylation domain-containing protein [Longimicrobiales bacterium]|nr:amino acid adenylation domain-containing protein [Longimicrobiales bacterium]